MAVCPYSKEHDAGTRVASVFKEKALCEVTGFHIGIAEYASLLDW
jgi:hypothetical protein